MSTLVLIKKFIIAILATIGVMTLLVAALDKNCNFMLPYVAPFVTFLTGICAIYSANKVSEKWREQKKFDALNSISLEILKFTNRISTDSLIMLSVVEDLTVASNNGYIKISSYQLNIINEIDFLSIFYEINNLMDTYLYIVGYKNQPLEQKLSKCLDEVREYCTHAKELSNQTYTTYSAYLEFLKKYYPDEVINGQINITKHFEGFPPSSEAISVMWGCNEYQVMMDKIKKPYEYQEYSLDNPNTKVNIYEKNIKDLFMEGSEITANFKAQIQENSGLHKIL